MVTRTCRSELGIASDKNNLVFVLSAGQSKVGLLHIICVCSWKGF